MLRTLQIQSLSQWLGWLQSWYKAVSESYSFPRSLASYGVWPQRAVRADLLSCPCWAGVGHLSLVSNNGPGPLPCLRALWHRAEFLVASSFFPISLLNPTFEYDYVLLIFGIKCIWGCWQGGWHKAWTYNILLSGIVARHFPMSFIHVWGNTVDTDMYLVLV